MRSGVRGEEKKNGRRKGKEKMGCRPLPCVGVGGGKNEDKNGK